MNGFLKFLLWFVGVVGVVGGGLYYFVFDIWTIPDDDAQARVAMLPTLAPGDIVLVSRKKDPNFGQLVRCDNPAVEGRFLIGRIVGLAGDTVALRSEALSVNGKREVAPGACESGANAVVENPSTGTPVEMYCSREEFGGGTHDSYRAKDAKEADGQWKVDEGRAFVMSDDIHLHQDSRDVGLVDPGTCQHIVFRFWGTSGFGDTKHRLSVIW